jgi:hypothetical protein
MLSVHDRSLSPHYIHCGTAIHSTHHACQVNVRDNMMETPMHKAARRNYILAYNMLKEAGGRDTLLNLMGETPADVLVDR